jgi:hypothetical protein
MLDRALAVQRALLIALDEGVGAFQLAVAHIHPQRLAEDFLGIVGGAQQRRGQTQQRAQARQPDPRYAMRHDAFSATRNRVPAGTMLPPEPGAREPGPSTAYRRTPP